ncbi:MAG: ATP-binding protein [Bacteroidales bacterium]
MEIAVISGKGGTGKSSISAAFATLGNEVVLADCDVDAANQYLIFNPTHEETEIFVGGQKAVVDLAACTQCGQCIEYCRFEAITPADEGIKISQVACEGCNLCVRMCPAQAIKLVNHDQSRLYAGKFRNGQMVYGRLAPGEENSGKLVSMVRKKARQRSLNTPVLDIIIDGPPGIGCPVISSVTGVDQVVIVTEPSGSGFHDLSRIVAVVKSFRIKKIWVIINKSDLDESMNHKIMAWCKEQGLEVITCLAFDSLFVEAIINCKSIIEWAPTAAVSIELTRAWKKITDWHTGSLKAVSS